MSLDVKKISDLYKASIIDKDNNDKLDKTGKSGRVSMAEYFKEEAKIHSAQNIGDMYDRGNHGTTEIEEKLTLNEEMLNKLGEVVNSDNYSKYEELGIIPDQDDPTSILTVSERIEIDLATHCDNYKGGRISISDLEAMYGSSGRAYQIANRLNSNNIYPKEDVVKNIEQAMDKIDSIKNINSSAAEYLLTNEKSVSIENVYKAIYSVAGMKSTSYEKLTESDWINLQGQVKSSVENMGFEANTNTMADARWLIETKIPLNSENIYKLSEIRDINKQLLNPSIGTNEWIDKLSKDIMFLGNAESSSMNFYKTVESSSIEAVTIIQNGTSEQITELLTDGKEVTLLNLKRVQEELSKDSQQTRREVYKEKTDKNNEEAKQHKFIAAKRTLEEARLKMSVEAGAMLIRSGFELNVAALSDVVDRLKEMENKIANRVFESIGHTATDDELNSYSGFGKYLKDFAGTNAYVLGNVYKREIDFTIIDIVEAGKKNLEHSNITINNTQINSIGKGNVSVLKNAFETYDVLGTKPDKALGDSINKAFQGIDGILEEMGIESNELNQRAVRILAYNQIEISKENILSIKAIDDEVSRLINNLSPKMTAYIIANGINPLNTDIKELNDELEKLREKVGYDDVEKYSEYLWKLQKNDAISEEDREAYIGIYRLLNMIEKGDRRAIGAIAKQGGELTLNSLLTVSRSLKKTDKEYVVDDETGLTESVKLSENNISNQLEKFIKDLEDNVNKHNINQNNYNKELNEIKSREIENLKHISEETLNNLFEDGTKRDMGNILGLSYIMNYGSGIFRKIKKVCEDEDVNANIEELEKSMLSDEFLEDTDTKNVELRASNSEEIYDEENILKEKIEKLNENVKAAIIGKSEINIEDIRQINGALKYMVTAANSQSYYVPMTFEGEQTLVKFTLKHDADKKGEIGVRIFGENEIEAKIKVTETKVKICDVTGLEDKDIEKLQDILNKRLENMNNVATNNVMIAIAKTFISCCQSTIF